jgi:NSS family neurotransmitter:Na+ symporter
MSQVMLGRLVRVSPISGVGALVKRMRLSHRWLVLGWLSVIAGFLVLSYYSVIAGWMLAYVARATSGALYGLTADGAGALFSSLVQDPEKQLFWHSLFIAMTMLAVVRGVRHGLEPVIRYVVPAMLGLLVVLVIYSASVGAFGRAVDALIVPDFTRLTGEGILVALGDAFFSLGLGAGAMMMYGAFLPENVSIARLSVAVALLDTAAAVLGGLVVLPLLFDGGNELVGGVGLVFQVIAVAFDPLPLGGLMRSLFFTMLVLVAWMSAIALIEPVIAWLVETREITRFRAAMLSGIVLWQIGVVMILSFNYWKFSFSILGQEKALGLLDITLIITSNLMLPACGILFAVFAGWALTTHMTREAMAMRSPCAYDIWLWLTRLAVPAGLLLILFNMRLFI